MIMPITLRTTVQVGHSGRDELFFNFELDAKGQLTFADLRGIGCPDLLQLIALVRPRLTGAINNLPLPEGRGHAEMLLRECFLRARGEWAPPYADVELCHCRAVPTAVVDDAIVCGARSPAAVGQKTSAGTSCGTCKTDIEAMLAYRLK